MRQRESFWNYAAVASEFIGTALLGILQSTVVVRKMAQSEYGQYCYTGTLFSYLAFFSSWAMMFMAVKEYSQRPAQAPKILAGIVQTRLIVTLPLAFVAIMLPGFVPQGGYDTMWLVAFLYVGMLINCFGGDLQYLFMSLNKQRVAAALGISNSVLNLLALLLVSQLPFGVSQKSVAGAMLFGPIVCTLLGMHLAKKRLGVDSLGLLRPQWMEVRQFLRNGYELLPGRIAVQIYATIAMVLVGVYLSLEDVAVFRVGAAFAGYVTGAALLSARITTPELARESVNLDSDRFRQAAYQHTYLLCLISFGAIVGTYGFGGWLLETIYGARYRASESATFWIVLQLLGMATLNGLDVVLYARGMNKQISLVAISGVVAGVVGGFILIPTLGVVGAGITVCLIQAVVHVVEIPFLPPEFRWFWVRPSLLPFTAMAASLAVIAILNSSWPQSRLLPLLGLGVLIAYFGVAGWPLVRKFLLTSSNKFDDMARDSAPLSLLDNPAVPQHHDSPI